jgi:chorismate dehydratase
MSDPARNAGEIPKLRMAPRETPEELAHRYDRERRALNVTREDRLEQSLDGFRVGSVPFLNAVPLTRGLEEHIEFIVPSRLAEKLRRGELDAALVSVTEVLFHDAYDILDGVAVASLGEVKSVFLAHRGPIESIQVVHCDTASLTSVNLVKVLLAERGLKPEFRPLPDYASAGSLENVVLIGDAAIQFSRENHPHQQWDLGAAWLELTGLPFVYAVWALRRGVENRRLRDALRAAKEFGLDTLDAIIQSRSEFDLEFRKDYLSWHIHYHLGGDEKRGLAKFVELLRRHSGQTVYDPKFVS